MASIELGQLMAAIATTFERALPVHEGEEL
jgi:hypothetical protein